MNQTEKYVHLISSLGGIGKTKTKNFPGLFQSSYRSGDLRTPPGTTFYQQHVASNRKGRTMMSKPALPGECARKYSAILPVCATPSFSLDGFLCCTVSMLFDIKDLTRGGVDHATLLLPNSCSLAYAT